MDEAALKYDINCLPDGSVVTKDGEYLGQFSTDETDAIWEFTPDGENAPVIRHPSVNVFCAQILEWANAR